MTKRFGREILTVVVVLLLASVAAEFAHLVRQLIHNSADLFYGDENVTEGMRKSDKATIIVLVTAGILIARFMNTRVQSWRPGQMGIDAVARSAHGADPGVSLGGTLVRSAATLVACVPGTSLGRESAILEAGGALGGWLSRRTGLHASALISAGVAAGFTTAYHSPLGAIAYVGGHLGVWRNRRAVAYAVLSAAYADWLSVTHLGGHPIFPGTKDSVGSLVVLGIIALVPAFIGARAFVRFRDFLARWKFGKDHQRLVLLVSVAVSVSIVVMAPLSAGNGMEALRHVAVGGSIAAAAALAVGKLLAVSATINARASGGVVAPTLAVAAGWVLMTYVGLEKLGVNLPGTHWGGMIIGMSVGAAVGLHSPLMASVMIAEMCGQMGMIPFTAVAAFLAHRAVDRLDRFEKARKMQVPAVMHAEDE